MHIVFYAPVVRPILSSGMNVRGRWQCLHGRCGTIWVRRAANLPPASVTVAFRESGYVYRDSDTYLCKQRDLVNVFIMERETDSDAPTSTTIPVHGHFTTEQTNAQATCRVQSKGTVR